MRLRLSISGILAASFAASPAFAQESPPRVSTETPALPDPGALAEDSTGLTLPGIDQAAEVTGVAAQPAAQSAAHTDLWTLVVVAHPVVQGVMGLLALSGFVALTILVYKSVELTLAARRLNRDCQTLIAAPTLHKAASAAQTGPAGAMIRAAASELSLAIDDPTLRPGTAQRTRATLARIEAGAVLTLRRGTGLLASIGALAPFIGLFGTVFGIMNSFLAIAATKTTNLAVVAPGIAEALLATAIGLAAAIPAVLIYNTLNRRIAGYRHRLADLATTVETLQSRELDRLSPYRPALAAE